MGCDKEHLAPAAGGEDGDVYTHSLKKPPPPPMPTEMVCVEVLKVFDFCVQTETREDLCTAIPAAAGVLPPGARAECEVVAADCVEVEPRRFFPDEEGIANVTLLVTVTVRNRLLRPDGTEIICFDNTFTFLKNVTLCAPEGTEIQCEIVNAVCGPAAITQTGFVCVQVVLCVVIQSKALVKLLIPAFGFCKPRPCVFLGKPFECPPPDLFPPQCPQIPT